MATSTMTSNSPNADVEVQENGYTAVNQKQVICAQKNAQDAVNALQYANEPEITEANEVSSKKTPLVS